MPVLQTISASEIETIAEGLDRITADSSTMEECAQRWMFHLFDNFVDHEGSGACALVRCFRTMRFANLSTELRDLAANVSTELELTGPTQCLVLLGTAGINAKWNSRHKSQGHRVIPLLSPEMVARSPMIAQLFRQLGIDVHEMLQPSDALLTEQHDRALDVFYVPKAKGSPYIPAQAEFVEPQGVRSVVGFGGVLPSGGVFAVILFTLVDLEREVAERLQALANNIKNGLAKFELDSGSSNVTSA